ncbi:MAG: hypothetical protein M1364_00790 [Candidatus Marsarchaeota archaeon]|nr:hypothetical protein [Candidatus Marsarchaeota archaeon]
MPSVTFGNAVSLTPFTPSTTSGWVAASPSTMSPGSVQTLTLPVPIGASSGKIWVAYTSTSSGTNYIIIQVGTATIS